LDTVFSDGQRGRLSLASSLNVDQGQGTIELHGDHDDQRHGASQEFHADQSYFTKPSLSSSKSVATTKILSAYRIREVEDLGHSVLVNYVETKFLSKEVKIFVTLLGLLPEQRDFLRSARGQSFFQ